jgi:hypothetical protein
LLVLARGTGQFFGSVNKVFHLLVIFVEGIEESFGDGLQILIDHHFLLWGRMHECANGRIHQLLLMGMGTKIKSLLQGRGKEAQLLEQVVENFANHEVECLLHRINSVSENLIGMR